MFEEKIKWKKLGKIFKPQTYKWWMRTHAMNPMPVLINGGPIVRVYFSGRDEHNRSQIGWLILNLNNPNEIIEVSEEPVIPLGRLGTFDDNGVAPISMVDVKDKKYLYYVGFKPGGTTRMDLFGGLAISEDQGLSFERYSEAPILERSKINPFINTAPFVLKERDLWRMYYVGGVEWIHKDLPRYNIQYATSSDGLEWKRGGHVCIDFASKEEHALAKPWVIKENDVYKMWFGYKGDASKGGAYVIGYAESKDGFNWIRNDDYAGIDCSKSGWDSEMIEYATVVIYQDRKYMFYNGNAYGRDGFGLAVQVKN